MRAFIPTVIVSPALVLLRCCRHWVSWCNVTERNMVGYQSPHYYNNPPIRKVRQRQLSSSLGRFRARRWAFVHGQSSARPTCTASWRPL